jgi:hypothetical protein
MLIDSEDEYEVKVILDSQMRYNCPEYLVKWKGHNDDHNSWHMHHQFHAQAKVAKFHCENPGVAYHINAALFHSIPFTQADLGNYLEILTHCDTTPLKGE